ncbi:MAG: FAD-dependent oxidoreductase [Thermoleophilaceae bacterium]|nr:FAD-dependent oxidoreductase [Thermoleophilaceae bacterium]
MRVAIIGAGISGLTTAHLLHRDHEITVFEADERTGGHTHTVPVDTDSGSYAIDTGFIVFNDTNYPNFERLLSEIGVDSQPSNMSFSVSDQTGDFEYSSTSPNGLYAKRGHLLDPRFHRMVADLLRFNREIRPLIGTNGDGPSLAEFLADGGYSTQFVERLIVPQASAVWSAAPGQMDSFPAGFMASFFENHGMLGFTNRPKWRTVKGGSWSYVKALSAPFADRIHAGSPVRSITRHDDRVELATDLSGALDFDQVVIAAHSDQALAMLADPTAAEREILGAIPYQANEAVLHTDQAMLPKRRRAWASWNFHLLDQTPARTTVTYHMNRLQALDSEVDFCVTLNHSEAIDPAKVIKRIDYSHPVYTAAGISAQKRHGEISGDRTHYCGAYWGWGFHEDGVLSAIEACKAFERVAA